MTTEKEVTAENLRFVRGGRGMSQGDVAAILGIAGNQVSKIEKGIRGLSPSEKALLDLHFFGTLPKGVTRASSDFRGALEFTEEEWTVIEILAKRAGLPPGKWIASKIREYLTWSDEARAVASGAIRAAYAEDSTAEGAASKGDKKHAKSDPVLDLLAQAEAEEVKKNKLDA